MKFTNIDQVNSFLKVVNQCKGEVWLESDEGDKINLHSKLSQYVAINALLTNYGDSLSLYCQYPEEEGLFMEWLSKHEEVL